MISLKKLFFVVLIGSVIIYHMNISLFLVWFTAFMIFLFLSFKAVSITFDDKKIKLPQLLGTSTSIFAKKTVERNVELFKDHPDILKEFDEISHLIVKDYILSWFERIDQDNESSFPKEVENVIVNAVTRLCSRLKNCDTVDLLILKLLPEINKHIDSFNIAKDNISSLQNNNGNVNNCFLHSRLIMEYNKLNKLHPAISSKSQDINKCIEGHLRSTVSNLLPILVEDELNSSIIRTLLREVLVTNIFTPFIVKYLEPDNWNLALISIARKILKERNQVHKVRKVLSKELKYPLQVNDYNDIANIEPLKINFALSSSCTSREFEAYLRQLSFLVSYSDLRATKFELSIKLMKLDDQYKERSKRIPKNEVIFRKRLVIALNLVDTKLKYLQPKINNAKDLINVEKKDDQIINELETFLDEIILDTHFLHDNVCLPFFKRFLDMESYNNAMLYLDYWETIESYKNPLENIESQDIIIEYSKKEVSFLEYIYNTFLTEEKVDVMKQLDSGLVNNILIFFSEETKTSNVNVFTLARKSVLLLQGQAEFVLNSKYFSLFKKSSMFLKMISSPNFTSTQVFKKYFKVSEGTIEDVALSSKSSIKSVQNNTENDSPTTNSKNDSRSQLQIKKIRNDPISADTVRIFTNPGINDALDRIVKDDLDFDINFSGNGNVTQRKNTSYDKVLRRNEKEESNKNNFLTADNQIFKDEKTSDEESITLSMIENDNLKEIIKRDVSTNDSEDSINYDFIKNTMNNHLYKFGNLKLEINKLNENIAQIGKELDLLRHLILKADLTNNKQQLMLLKKSQRTLNRELEKNELLRQQYIIQENTNSLYKKTKVSINSYFVDSQYSNFRDVVFYIINITHVHKSNVTTWEIPRRYSEFYELNKYLKITYKTTMYQNKIKDCFPGKIKINWNFSKSITDLYEDRKLKLLNYLEKCLKYQEICSDEMFRKFLTDTDPFTINHKDIDNIKKLKRESGLYNSDDISIASSNIYSENAEFDNSIVDDIESSFDYTHSLIDKDKGFNFSNQPFLKPVCDLFIILFSLNRSNSIWLRGGAIILVLQQIFGATIEKYIRDSILRVEKPEFILESLIKTKESLWGPNGYFEQRKLRSLHPPLERTDAEKQRTQRDSKLLFQILFIEISGKVVGKKHAKEGAVRLHNAVQEPTLNASLLLKLFDIIIEAIEQN